MSSISENVAESRDDPEVMDTISLLQDEIARLEAELRMRDELAPARFAMAPPAWESDGLEVRDRRIAELEAQIEQRDQVIGEYTIANRLLKKLSGPSH